MPADWQRSVPFGGVLTFMGAPTTRDLSNADVAIIGVPLDIGTTYRSGARFGPRAIRESTGPMELHAWDEDELYEPFRSLRVIDYGDLGVNAGYIEAAVERIEKGISAVLDADVFPVILGGDHTISLPVLRALHRKHGKLSLLHFDAHPDFWEPTPERPVNPRHPGEDGRGRGPDRPGRLGHSRHQGILVDDDPGRRPRRRLHRHHNGRNR